jgi:hypothetical protein
LEAKKCFKKKWKNNNSINNNNITNNKNNKNNKEEEDNITNILFQDFKVTEGRKCSLCFNFGLIGSDHPNSAKPHDSLYFQRIHQQMIQCLETNLQQRIEGLVKRNLEGNKLNGSEHSKSANQHGSKSLIKRSSSNPKQCPHCSKVIQSDLERHIRYC